jgi:hypothetical protein
MYQYVPVCTVFAPGIVIKINQSAAEANLRVHGMEELLWQIEGIASCMYHTLNS